MIKDVRKHQDGEVQRWQLQNRKSEVYSEQ